jgi:hypothetical protein
MLNLCKSGKQCHSTQEEARRHWKHLQDAAVTYSGRVYHCSRCGTWHVGREKKRAHQNRCGFVWKRVE